MLGRYYRVGFYGIRFEELNGKEFVYKEPKSTHLFEVSEKMKVSTAVIRVFKLALQEFYGRRFGAANVIVFPDSSKVDTSKLEPHKCRENFII
jgi:hypothetical protein